MIQTKMCQLRTKEREEKRECGNYATSETILKTIWLRCYKSSGGHL